MVLKCYFSLIMSKYKVRELEGIEILHNQLRDFADIALRLYIYASYGKVRKGHKYSVLLEPFVLSGHDNFGFFKKDLRENLSKSVNPELIKKDLKDRFKPIINKYEKWFEKNRKDTMKFEPYNPYRLMVELIVNTGH